MNEYERIINERNEEALAWQNAKNINRVLRGKRVTTRAEAVRIMRAKYSKYGKRYKRLLSELCFSEAGNDEKTEESKRL